jgi:uncharacterized membrane protein YhaH (DUF805 family)
VLDAVRSVYRKYADFSGRATRSEFWLVWLFHSLAIVVLSFAAAAAGSMASIANTAIGVFVLGSIIPTLALTVRRLHDTGRSGWWLLLGFVPVIGGLILLFWYMLPSTPGPNRFDAPPMPATA